MTVPARFPLTTQCSHVANTSRFHKFGVQLIMAADAIVHHHLTRQFFGPDSLRFSVQDEVC